VSPGVPLGERAKRLAIAIAWIALYAVVAAGLAWVLLKLNPVPPRSAWYNAAATLALAAACGGATWLVGVAWNRQPWEHWGWHRRHGADTLVSGAALGVLMAALAVGLAFVANRTTVRLTGDWSRYLGVAGPLVAFLLAAALFEELMFRGYPLRRLADAIGPRAAVPVLALGFAAGHAAHPGVGAFGLANIALAGVWLSFAFFSPGGMALAWGLHFGWNAGLALLFDAPVSGQRLLVPAVEYQPGRHAWVDGGAFGPEGGAVATIVLIAGTLAVLGKRFRQPKDWLV
jgi:membrane protease YdiL (CAAX protease family)